MGPAKNPKGSCQRLRLICVLWLFISSFITIYKYGERNNAEKIKTQTTSTKCQYRVTFSTP